MKPILAGAVVITLASLYACRFGGGGGDFPSDVWKPGVFARAPLYAARCAKPRSGSSEVTGIPFPDVQGKALDERNWLRSWTHELYLWYAEVPDLNPASYGTLEYFEQLKTPVITSSGRPKDKFHFTLATDRWEAIEQAGEEAGYGFQWELISDTVPRHVVVAYLEPAAPAATLAAGIGRGDELLSVDGIEIESTTVPAEIAAINAALFPASAGETHRFVLRDGAGAIQEVALTSSTLPAASVMNVKTIATVAGVVGYLQFNNHVAPAEQALIDAVEELRAANGGAGVDDLVLDIRYNGGGLLDVASELAYMIAGNARTASQTFELDRFNSQYPSKNPVTNQPLKPIPFYTQAIGYSAAAGTTLPTLNLPRVFVLTGGGTCSASESIINSLRGIDVDVIQIGTTTCGKPYGFFPADNCGTTYFSIQFEGVNAKGFGDYGDGYAPDNTAGVAGVRIPGCSVADDFTHGLGEASELVLAAALNYRQSAACPAPAAAAASGKMQTQALPSVPEPGRAIRRPFWRENRIVH